jgi:glycosyltransferase involved in cell wall biosynthesis
MPDPAPPESVPALRASLDMPLPAQVAVGGGTTLFVCGSCFHERRRVVELEVRLGSERAAPIAQGMPRADRAREFGPGAFKSGFWAIVPVHRRERNESARIELHAKLDDGSGTAATLAELELLASRQRTSDPWRVAPGAERSRVAICMTTFNPALELFERQVESLRGQSHDDWVCLVSDDHSEPERFAAIERLLAGDERFIVSRSEHRRGIYRNFERALEMAPADVGWIALCDQDDVWHPDKLSVLLDEIGAATVAYSDARVVDARGNLRSPTYWSSRRNNWTNLTSLVLANSITGAAALYRRDLLERALPFPPVRFLFHDHWLAVVGRAIGEVAYVDRPLYDYVQHDQAALGHETANAWAAARRTTRDKVRIARKQPQFFYDHWRATYFSEYCRMVQIAIVVLMRCGDRLDRRGRRALERLARGEHAPVELGARLAVRGLRFLLGHDETMHAEHRQLRGLAWRYLLELAPTNRPTAALPRDASYPQFEWPRPRGAS